MTTKLKTAYEEIVNVSMIGKAFNPNFVNEVTPQLGNSSYASQISTLSLPEILAKAETEELSPASDDAKIVTLIAIDVQYDFMPGGVLGVPGADGDVARLTKFIYNNMAHITRIVCSLDTHAYAQIFHPTWWVNQRGQHPSPFTVITLKDVEDGVWMPTRYIDYSKVYLSELEKRGRKQLCIWPYHCIQGTIGACLEQQFANMVYFHSSARKSVPLMLQKGYDPKTEMYGIIRAEYDETGAININVLNQIAKSHMVLFAGEAKSHCFDESVYQTLEYFKDNPEVTRKIYFLEDCTSSIPGHEAATDAAFEGYKRKYGVNIVKSTDVLF